MNTIKYKIIIVIIAVVMIASGVIIEKKKTQDIVKRYDRFGLWMPGTTPIFLNENENGETKATYRDGKIINIIDTWKSKVSYEWKVDYDKQGRISYVLFKSKSEENNSPSVEYKVTRYDEKGRATEVNGTDIMGDDKTDFILRYTYNNQGYLDSYRFLDKNNVLRTEVIYEYDKNANLIRRKDNFVHSNKTSIVAFKNADHIDAYCRLQAIEGFGLTDFRKTDESIRKSKP